MGLIERSVGRRRLRGIRGVLPDNGRQFQNLAFKFINAGFQLAK
jgi:hypothetical protein